MKKKFNFDRISKTTWIQRWSGSYTLISCSYWGPQYHHTLKRILGEQFDHTLFIHRKGVASFYLPQEEFRHLGQEMAKKVMKSSAFATKNLNWLKKNTDILMPMMKKLQKKIPTLAEYKKFHSAFERHLAYHVFMKKTVDFLSVDALNKLLPIFTDARLYSEAIYSETEAFFRNVMKLIGKKEGYNAHDLTCLYQPEFEEYLRVGSLPSPELLKKRYAASALYFEKDKMTELLGKDAEKVDVLLGKQSTSSRKELKGISAYPGQVKGRCRIVPDPFNVQAFDEGDILVTGMTRPEFLPLIEKAAAIVTESGGILCHAAIIARELKKPCIVGTQVAMKVLKDGDMAEINANKGIVYIK